MLSFIAQRLFQSLLVMLTVALIAFAMFRYVGDPRPPWWARTPRRNNVNNCASSWA